MPFYLFKSTSIRHVCVPWTASESVRVIRRRIRPRERERERDKTHPCMQTAPRKSSLVDLSPLSEFVVQPAQNKLLLHEARINNNSNKKWPIIGGVIPISFVGNHKLRMGMPICNQGPPFLHSPTKIALLTASVGPLFFGVVPLSLERFNLLGTRLVMMRGRHASALPLTALH